MLLTPLQREVVKTQFNLSLRAVDLLQHIHGLDQFYRSANGLAKGYQRAAGQVCLGGYLSAVKELQNKKLVQKRLRGQKGKKQWYLLLTALGKDVFELMEHCNKTVDELVQARPTVQNPPATRVSWGRPGERKVGTIVAYVPALDLVEELHGIRTLYDYVTKILEVDLKQYDLGGIKPLTSDTYIKLRNTPSALVRVDRGSTRKPALYWPTKYTELVEAK